LSLANRPLLTDNLEQIVGETNLKIANLVIDNPSIGLNSVSGVVDLPFMNDRAKENTIRKKLVAVYIAKMDPKLYTKPGLNTILDSVTVNWLTSEDVALKKTFKPNLQKLKLIFNQQLKTPGQSKIITTAAQSPTSVTGMQLKQGSQASVAEAAPHSQLSKTIIKSIPDITETPNSCFANALTTKSPSKDCADYSWLWTHDHQLFYNQFCGKSLKDKKIYATEIYNAAIKIVQTDPLTTNISKLQFILTHAINITSETINSILFSKDKAADTDIVTYTTNISNLTLALYYITGTQKNTDALQAEYTRLVNQISINVDKYNQLKLTEFIAAKNDNGIGKLIDDIIKRIKLLKESHTKLTELTNQYDAGFKDYTGDDDLDAILKK
jgi:hypothetical protein